MQQVTQAQEKDWIKHRIQFLETEKDMLGLLEDEELELIKLKEELASYEI